MTAPPSAPERIAELRDMLDAHNFGPMEAKVIGEVLAEIKRLKRERDFAAKAHADIGVANVRLRAALEHVFTCMKGIGVCWDCQQARKLVRGAGEKT
jgi:hypothetical protein